MRNILLAVAMFVTAWTPSASLADWTTITLDQPYRYWHHDPDGGCLDDVLSLNAQAIDPAHCSHSANFTNQVLSNPHVQYNDNGEWLIMGYGDASLGDTAVGDAIYVMKRLNTGWYRVPTQAALAWHRDPFGRSWPSVGGLGAGAGITKTPTVTTAGYKYFAAVQVGRAPTTSNQVFTTGWTTWAVSQNGETWAFVSQSGGLTDDPGQSLQMIRRADLSQLDNNTPAGNRFWHIAMVYNPSDNYFYIVMGWGGVCGLKGTWWRLHFDSSNAYGLPYDATTGRYAIEVLSNNTTYVRSELTNGSNGVTDGLITDYSDLWQCAAQSPQSTPANGFSGPADPMDIVQLYKQDGSVDSMLFIYRPEQDANKIFYVKGSLPGSGTANFTWSAPQTLDLSALYYYPDGTRYSTCGAGGFYVCVNQNGWQANGKPNLFGFVATWRSDIYTPDPGGCGGQPQGLLPLHFTLN